MIVNSITQPMTFKGSKGTPKASSLHSLPRMAAPLVLSAVLAGCPQAGEPPKEVTAAGATAGAGGIGGAGGTGGINTTPTTPRTVNSELNAAWSNAGISMSTEGTPEVIEYDDSRGSHVIETKNPKASEGKPNTVVYDGISNGLEKEYYTSTYSFDEKTGELRLNKKFTEAVRPQDYIITKDIGGYTVFTNANTGEFAHKMIKRSTGIVEICDKNGNKVATLSNFKTDGFYAKLESLFERFGKAIYDPSKSEIRVPLGKGEVAILPAPKKLAGQAFHLLG